MDSDSALRRVMDELQREREDRLQEREDQQRQIQTLQQNVSLMMDWFNTMNASQTQQPGMGSSGRQTAHPDYVEEDEDDE